MLQGGDRGSLNRPAKLLKLILKLMLCSQRDRSNRQPTMSLLIFDFNLGRYEACVLRVAGRLQKRGYHGGYASPLACLRLALVGTGGHHSLLPTPVSASQSAAFLRHPSNHPRHTNSLAADPPNFVMHRAHHHSLSS